MGKQRRTKPAVPNTQCSLQILLTSGGARLLRSSASRILEIELTGDVVGMMHEDSISDGQIPDMID
jgi:hypothetical protein